MVVYITKYALTRGIIEKEVTMIRPTMVRADNYNYYHKPYWHETKEEAIKHAEEMRVKAIASTKKRLEALEKLSFKN